MKRAVAAALEPQHAHALGTAGRQRRGGASRARRPRPRRPRPRRPLRGPPPRRSPSTARARASQRRRHRPSASSAGSAPAATSVPPPRTNRVERPRPRRATASASRAARRSGSACARRSSRPPRARARARAAPDRRSSAPSSTQVEVDLAVLERVRGAVNAVSIASARGVSWPRLGGPLRLQQRGAARPPSPRPASITRPIHSFSGRDSLPPRVAPAGTAAGRRCRRVGEGRVQQREVDAAGGERARSPRA